MHVSKRHEQQIKKVCDFVDSHLNDTFSLEQLCAVAASSKYHFHRIFKSFMGVSVMQYAMLSKMKRASFRLAFEHQYSITDIAFEAQFESLEAFSRAFSRIFGCSPSQFRHQPNWLAWHKKFEFYPPNIEKDNVIDVKIVEFERREIGFIEHKGNPKLFYHTLQTFIKWRQSIRLTPKNSETFGIPYSNPQFTLDDEFHQDICCSHLGAVRENSYGAKSGIIPGGRCAVAVHKGNRDTVIDTVNYLYGKWLPNSHEELRDFPCFFKYINFSREVDECDLITEVYLPLKD